MRDIGVIIMGLGTLGVSISAVLVRRIFFNRQKIEHENKKQLAIEIAEPVIPVLKEVKQDEDIERYYMVGPDKRYDGGAHNTDKAPSESYSISETSTTAIEDMIAHEFVVNARIKKLGLAHLEDVDGMEEQKPGKQNAQVLHSIQLHSDTTDQISLASSETNSTSNENAVEENDTNISESKVMTERTREEEKPDRPVGVQKLSTSAKQSSHKAPAILTFPVVVKEEKKIEPKVDTVSKSEGQTEKTVISMAAVSSVKTTEQNAKEVQKMTSSEVVKVTADGKEPLKSIPVSMKQKPTFSVPKSVVTSTASAVVKVTAAEQKEPMKSTAVLTKENLTVIAPKPPVASTAVKPLPTATKNVKSEIFTASPLTAHVPKAATSSIIQASPVARPDVVNNIENISTARKPLSKATAPPAVVKKGTVPATVIAPVAIKPAVVNGTVKKVRRNWSKSSSSSSSESEGKEVTFADRLSRFSGRDLLLRTRLTSHHTLRERSLRQRISDRIHRFRGSHS